MIEATRQAVSEWLNNHPDFRAALPSRRQELWVGRTDTLRGLLLKTLVPRVQRPGGSRGWRCYGSWIPVDNLLSALAEHSLLPRLTTQ